MMRNSAAMLGACAALAAAPVLAEEGQPFAFAPAAPSATQLASLPMLAPSGLKLAEGDFRFDIAPHAGTQSGLAPSFGGTLRLGPKDRNQAVREGLGRIGVSARDGSSFKSQGRVYLFAAASGTAVGMNVVRSDDGWSRALSTDRAASLMLSGQAGVGWRQQDLQASLGYVRRKFKIKDPRQQAYPDLYDSADDAVALSVSFKPSR